MSDGDDSVSSTRQKIATLFLDPLDRALSVASDTRHSTATSTSLARTVKGLHGADFDRIFCRQSKAKTTALVDNLLEKLEHEPNVTGAARQANNGALVQNKKIIFVFLLSAVARARAHTR